jgi:hypothetical protein
MVQVEELCITNNSCSDVPNKGWRCLDIEDDSGESYSLDGLATTFYDSDDLVSGETILSISDAAIDKGDKGDKGKKISVDPDALVSKKKTNEGDGKKGGKNKVDGKKGGKKKAKGKKGGKKRNLRHGGKHEERKLAQLQGTSSVLVIHVTDTNGDTTPQTANQLASDMFSDEVNLVRNFGFLMQKYKTTLRS